jgi:uncharacterized protein (DUF433 family)
MSDPPSDESFLMLRRNMTRATKRRGTERTMTAEIISAFTEEQTSRLTGLTVHRLRHWDKTKFFVPSLAADDRRNPYSRVYSFHDLLALQVLKALRIDMGCSLQHLREVGDRLAHLGDALWARTTLYVLNKKVVFHDHDADELREPVSGQIVLQIPLHVIRTGMEKSVRELSKRGPNEVGKVERKRNVRHNAPVIAGTRISVAAVKRLSEDGFSTQQILAEFPSLTESDVAAALKYVQGKHAA